MGHTPTQSVEMLWDVQASGYGLIILMRDADGIGALLGYSENLICDAHAADTPVEGAIFRASEAAHFDTVSLFRLHISCVNGSNYHHPRSTPGLTASASSSLFHPVRRFISGRC